MGGFGSRFSFHLAAVPRLRETGRDTAYRLRVFLPFARRLLYCEFPGDAKAGYAGERPDRGITRTICRHVLSGMSYTLAAVRPDKGRRLFGNA
jgi:hypothetical protein